MEKDFSIAEMFCGCVNKQTREVEGIGWYTLNIELQPSPLSPKRHEFILALSLNILFRVLSAKKNIQHI